MLPNVEKPLKIGLTLGGGGARGLAHIGVLKVLEREQIPIAYLSGTSMGGIVGALYASGMTVAEIEAEASQVGYLKALAKFVDFQWMTKGMVKGKRIHKYMIEKLGADLTFSDLHLPLAVVAVDVNSGRDVVFTGGAVADAVRATMSIPGVFAPVKVGNFNLIDGGILNNVPVDAVRGLGADAVIAVDVLPSCSANRPGEPLDVHPISFKHMPRFAQETYRVLMIMISEITQLRLEKVKPEVLIRPDIPSDMGLLIGFDRYAEAIHAGEQATEASLLQIRALLD